MQLARRDANARRNYTARRAGSIGIGGSRARDHARDRVAPRTRAADAGGDVPASADRESATRRAARAPGRRATARRRVCLESFSPCALIATGTCRYSGVGDVEHALQVDLPRRRRQEVRAAHDRRHALVRVVDDDRELVREQPSARRTMKSPTSRARSCRCGPCNRSMNDDDRVARRGRGARRAVRARPDRRVAARARIDALAAGVERRRLQVAARARASVDEAGVAQPRERIRRRCAVRSDWRTTSPSQRKP